MHLRGTKPDFDQMLHQIHHQINLQELPGQLQKARSANKMTRFYLTFSKIAAVTDYSAFIGLNLDVFEHG